MVLAASHLVIASSDVTAITKFVAEAFMVAPAFENDMFSEFVLPSRFRVAFFVPVGPSARTFEAEASRRAVAVGVTVADVDAMHAHLVSLQPRFAHQISGPPKDHPWGEKSFLLTDPDGNRWEITQSPSVDGLLVPRPDVPAPPDAPAVR